MSLKDLFYQIELNKGVKAEFPLDFLNPSFGVSKARCLFLNQKSKSQFWNAEDYLTVPLVKKNLKEEDYYNLIADSTYWIKPFNIKGNTTQKAEALKYILECQGKTCDIIIHHGVLKKVFKNTDILNLKIRDDAVMAISNLDCLIEPFRTKRGLAILDMDNIIWTR